jgi:uncharacterized OB-fold protein
MGRGLVRAALYLPGYTDGRCRIGGADEDAFTFAATALERALRPEPDDVRELVLRSLGTAASLDPEAVAPFVGRRPTPAPGSASLSEALRLAQAARHPELIVAVAAAREAGSLSARDPPGEGAVALLVDDRPDAEALPELPPAAGLGALGEIARAHGAPGVWVGDWKADPAGGRVLPSEAAASSSPGYTVSQGAFVPAPRYDEGRPSRWGFVAQRCASCSTLTFPARGRCRRCGAESGLRGERLPLNGATVVASTWIGPGGQPTEFDPQVEMSGPYGVVLAELVPGVRATLQVADARPADVRVGSRVDTVLRRLYAIEGAWRYGRKAVPASGTP